MSQPYIIAYLPTCKQWEGCVPHFYLDTRGNVTVWVGFLVETALIAKTLPMYLPGLTVAATVDEIARAWNTVDAMQEGYMPAFYAYPGCLQMQEKDGDALLLTILDQTDANLQRDYPGFEGFPDAVKMALADCDFNLGDTKLRTTYPHLDSAVDSQDWATAANQCFRHGISQARNDWTKQQFLSALT